MRLLNATSWGAATLVWTILCAARTGSPASLQLLDFTPSAVSADGSVVVGGGAGGAVRWTAAGGATGLGQLPGRYNGVATDVSADGSVIVGNVSASASAYEPRAYRWTASTGMVELGTFPDRPHSEARGVSAEGTVVVGRGYGPSARDSEAFRWTALQGMVSLSPGTLANDASADGSVAVGTGEINWFAPAARWTESMGWMNLVAPASASAVSADGSVVVGTIFPAHDQGSLRNYAFRWTQSDGFVSFGRLGHHSWATDVSADGSVVVGASDGAFIWDEGNGMRRLRDVLEGLGVDTAGVPMDYVEAISADGRTIVGYGNTGPGQFSGWIATVPEPVGLSSSALTSAWLLRRRRPAR